ncbi:MAG: hypothetical protein M3O36_15170 [Myxococcota bacterium]|nr:hypothetical protein [Myxococcota bacterium]
MNRFCPFVVFAWRVPFFMALLAACGSASPPSAADMAAAKAREATSVDNRLQGSWRLVDFRPEVPDPMFNSLLTAQLGVMIVRFERGHLYADSPAFHVTRPYQIVDVAGPYFTVQSPDVGTAVFATKATLSDDDQRISFRGDTDPWRGSGTLVRVR